MELFLQHCKIGESAASTQQLLIENQVHNLFALPGSHYASDARVSMDGFVISKDWQTKAPK